MKTERAIPATQQVYSVRQAEKGARRLHHHLIHLLDTYGYFGLFVWLAAEYLFIPVPGETTLVTTGILWRYPQYHLSLFWLIVATTLGTFTGSLFGYAFGRVLGRPFLLRFGRYVRLTPTRVDRAESMFHRYTLPTLLISRFIAFVRVIVPYLAGINQVPLWVFVPTMLLGSLVWTTAFILAGTLIERLWHTVSLHWRADLIPAMLAAAILVTAYLWLHNWLQRRTGDAVDAADRDNTNDADKRR